MDTDWSETLEERWRALTDTERLRMIALCCPRCGAISACSVLCRAPRPASRSRTMLNCASVRVAMGRFVAAVGWTTTGLRIVLDSGADGRSVALVIYGLDLSTRDKNDNCPVGFVGSRLSHIDQFVGPGGPAVSVVTSAGEWVIRSPGEVRAQIEMGVAQVRGVR